MMFVLYVLLGLAAGFVGGALGLGGGAIMVPVMVYYFGLTQHQAQGTALTVLLPPVFIFAVWRYFAEGNVKLQMAAFIAAGFVLGALLGAHCVQNVSDPHLKKIFGVFMILIGIKMTFFR